MSGMKLYGILGLARGRPRCKRCGGFVNGWEARLDDDPEQVEPACSCADRYRRTFMRDVSAPPVGDLFVWAEAKTL